MAEIGSIKELVVAVIVQGGIRIMGSEGFRKNIPRIFTNSIMITNHGDSHGDSLEDNIEDNHGDNLGYNTEGNLEDSLGGNQGGTNS